MANVVALLKGNSQKSNSTFFNQLVENMPIAVMTCRVSDFKIDYVNPSSRKLLNSIRHVLSINPDDIVGTCVDVFHKEPDHQRQILGNDSNLPYQTNIKLGDEVIELNISALYNKSGVYTHAMLSWALITEKVRKQEHADRLIQMIDNMPINVMTCDIQDDFKINYANKTSIETLKSVESHLPISVSQLVGSSIDVFHKRPQHQRDLLADPSHLPHSATIRVGPEILKLEVSAINDADGKYTGPMLSWSIITDNHMMAENVSGVAHTMSEKANMMDDASNNMVQLAKTAEELAVSVASAAEELNVTVSEISAQVASSSAKAQEATVHAQETDKLVGSLDEAATAIGGVVEVIEDIAEKTNLLALNATIEAARAGTAGKGFAVVASEVKDLANQTTRSTQEIREQISSMQNIVKSTVQAIGQIAVSISELSGAFSSIAAAVEEQSATTATVSRDIGGVQDASLNTGQAAEDVKQVAIDLNKQSEDLRAQIEDYIKSS